MDPMTGVEQLAYDLASSGVSKRSALAAFKRFCANVLTDEERTHEDLLKTYRLHFLFVFGLV